MKKKVSISLLVLCVLLSSGFAFAVRDEGNVGVSPIKPGEFVTRSTDVPKSTWNIAKEGTYSFSGQAAYETLYTEYLLTGQTSYDISVYNKKGYRDYLDVEVLRSKWGRDESLTTNNVQGQTTEEFSVSDLKKKDKIYIAFYAPSHCKGNIK